ncbi:hypothetical protein TomTYG75_27540 [Sphingobium sp. TomTYG75]
MTVPGTRLSAGRLLWVIALILILAALRASYAVTMPILFAAIIVAALWPLKLWLDKRLPSWLSYTLTVATLVIILTVFVAAVYLSLGQLMSVLGAQWPKLVSLYDAAADKARDWGVTVDARLLDQQRIVAFAQMLASSIYSFVTYVGFIGLFVILGLPEVARMQDKMRAELELETRGQLRSTMISISEQVRRYFSTTLATSLLTGAASTLWALATGLDLPIVWGLLNFLLNFVPRHRKHHRHHSADTLCGVAISRHRHASPGVRRLCRVADHHQQFRLSDPAGTPLVAFAARHCRRHDLLGSDVGHRGDADRRSLNNLSRHHMRSFRQEPVGRQAAFRLIVRGVNRAAAEPRQRIVWRAATGTSDSLSPLEW